MQGPTFAQQAAVETTVRPAAHMVRALQVPAMSRDESRRRMRQKLLRFILKNHNRNQVDSQRGLRIVGAD